MDAQLYATYVELVDDSSANGRRREQWIILPPMPARLAPGDSPITSHLSYFDRTQRNPTHRAVWHYHEDTSDTFPVTLKRRLKAYTDTGWEVSPIIVCEVDPTELAQVLRERRTPYRIKERLEKVARLMYKVDIT